MVIDLRSLKTLDQIRPEHWNPEFAFIDADNVYRRYVRELERCSLSDQEHSKFEFFRLFRVRYHDRRFIYSATNNEVDLPKWLEETRRESGFILKLGQLTEKNGRRKQEGVDVKLAIDATRFSYSGILKSCALYGADGDFIPLVEALSEAGCKVSIYSFDNPDKGRVAPTLQAAADEYVKMDEAWLYETIRPEHRTVAKYPNFFHKYLEAESRSTPIDEVAGKSIYKIDSTNFIMIGDASPSGLYGSHVLDDLCVWWKMYRNLIID